MTTSFRDRNKRRPASVLLPVEASSHFHKTTTPRRFVLSGLALAGALTTGDFALETRHVTITRHALRLAGLKQPCRLVQLSDLHRSWCVSESFIHAVVTQTNALKPDVIALTGDFVTRHSGYIGSCADALKSLQAPFGMFAVLGNHDYVSDERRGAPIVVEGLRSIGVQMLTNRSERLENGLRLVGVDDFRTGSPDPATAFHSVRRGEAMLAMTHNPFAFGDMCRYDCVTLAGHTHGGQINVPGLTAHVIGGRMRYQHGWYQEPQGPGRLYVSRGLGVVGMPFRFHSAPEIAVFDLIPA